MESPLRHFIEYDFFFTISGDINGFLLHLHPFPRDQRQEMSDTRAYYLHWFKCPTGLLLFCDWQMNRQKKFSWLKKNFKWMTHLCTIKRANHHRDGSLHNTKPCVSTRPCFSLGVVPYGLLTLFFFFLSFLFCTSFAVLLMLFFTHNLLMRELNVRRRTREARKFKPGVHFSSPPPKWVSNSIMKKVHTLRELHGTNSLLKLPSSQPVLQ